MTYYLNRLSMIAAWMKKDFDKAAKKDIEEVMRKINQMNYTEWTKRDYRVTLNRYGLLSGPGQKQSAAQ